MAESEPDGRPSGPGRWEGLDDIVAQRRAEASPEDRDYPMEAGIGKGLSGDNSDEERLQGWRQAVQSDLTQRDLLDLEEKLRRANRRVFGPTAGQTGMTQVHGYPIEPEDPLTEPTQLLRPVEPPDEQRHQ